MRVAVSGHEEFGKIAIGAQTLSLSPFQISCGVWAFLLNRSIRKINGSCILRRAVHDSCKKTFLTLSFLWYQSTTFILLL